MKYIILVLSLLWLCIGVAAAQEMSADEILKNVDDALDLSGSVVEIEMQVYREKQLQRTYRINLKYQDEDHMLGETLYPPRNAGEKSLHVGENRWLYLPKLNKVMRVSESNSFSNSDFSNMDIMQSRLGTDYTPKLLGIEQRDGVEAYKLELTAKTDDVPYKTVIYWIRKGDFYPLQRDYYTFSGNLLKRLTLETRTNVRGGLPDIYIMTSVLEDEKYTIMRISSILSDQVFPPEIFRKDALMKR
ncbi:outer membrane lipoprotein-sorting protein [Candidatus Moduliflexus flocculans]|uniref:Outer membrane lipoprotein-sorting protein n=1 Tax=Candidatus Moduliflexus flocculans TaxID=1499966 RepID=A0A0S6VU72_9BACT|nr:outer membrane lipoprotein-sorting protein [Candidatus Moduliflexus flocculans]